jgi:hypothetical protein
MADVLISQSPTSVGPFDYVLIRILLFLLVGCNTPSKYFEDPLEWRFEMWADSSEELVSRQRSSDSDK